MAYTQRVALQTKSLVVNMFQHWKNKIMVNVMALAKVHELGVIAILVSD